MNEEGALSMQQAIDGLAHTAEVELAPTLAAKLPI